MPSTSQILFLARDFTLAETWEGVGVAGGLGPFDVATLQSAVQGISQTHIAEGVLAALDVSDDGNHGSSANYGSNAQTVTFEMVDSAGYEEDIVLYGPSQAIFLSDHVTLDLANAQVTTFLNWIFAHGLSSRGNAWSSITGGFRTLAPTAAQAIVMASQLFGDPAPSGWWYAEDGFGVEVLT